MGGKWRWVLVRLSRDRVAYEMKWKVQMEDRMRLGTKENELLEREQKLKAWKRKLLTIDGRRVTC